jgi:copper chaperone CopZ
MQGKESAMKTMTPYVLALALPMTTVFFSGVAHSKTVTEDWYLEGPRSGADVKRVENAIRALPGVSYAEVSEATVQVRFDNQKVDDARLRAAVAHAGDFHLKQRVD